MDKQYKPVPDVECLKYHGTPENPDIKIFVSHRIDLDSETIDNPLYIPVRCGAVYDERENVTMLGDDTGENISEYSDRYGFLSVLYWAWKNIRADYYGFSTENEYVTFDATQVEKQVAENSEWKHYSKAAFGPLIKNVYGLTTSKILADVTNVGIIAAYPQKIMGKDFLQKYYMAQTCCDKVEDLNLYIDTIRDMFPEMYKTAGNMVFERFIYQTPIIMQKKFFDDFCSKLFSLLNAMKSKIDDTYYSESKRKQFEFFYLIFLRLYLDYSAEQKNVNIKEKSILTIDDMTKSVDLSPAFSQNNIPIALFCSNEYVPYLSVYLRSLLDHVSDNNYYDIIVFHKRITEENQELLSQMCKEYKNVSIRFFNPKEKLQNISFYVAQKEYCEEAYYRLFVPWYMDKYKKAIVMDCDILVRRDLADLYAVDLKENYVAGVVDAVFQGMLNGWATPDTMEYALNEMRMKNPHEYLNTGVLLFDLEKMRSHYSENQLIELSQTKKFRCQEQDILNVILEGHVLFLNFAWNCYVRSGDFVNWGLKWAPKYVYDEFQKAIQNPYLVHFISYPKPWLDPRIEYGQQFWITARRTPYYETILFLMMESRYGGPIFELNQRTFRLNDNRTPARRLGDKLLPKGTRRREFAKKILPRGSRRWRFCKKIYYFFCPSARPAV